MNTTINGYASPAAYVSKGKQRLKQYNDTVYLNNGDEFEIELFNPTQRKVLAKIELNGNSIGNGIILRPGERVFLERYLDVAKKFLFEIYNVDGTDNDVQKAIIDNGSVQVNFFCENTLQSYNTSSLILNGNNITHTFYPTYDWNTTTTLGTGNVSTSFTTTNAFYSNSSNSSLSLGKNILRKKTVETGRIEKGSDSNQNFTYDNSNFYSWTSWTSKWKILPFSQKPLVKEDIKVYCGECKTKRKKDSYKFCPQCGTKFSNRTETKIIYIDDAHYTNENGRRYYLQTFRVALDKLIELNKNKLIVIKRDSLTENELRAIILD